MRILFLIILLVPSAAWAQAEKKGGTKDFNWTSKAGVQVGGPAGVISFQTADIRFQGEPVKDSPYSAEAVTETTQTLADGNRIRRENRTRIYRDSAGRTRREETIHGIGPWSAARDPKTVVFIQDPVEGTHYVLHPEEKTARKMPIPKLHEHLSGLVKADAEAERNEFTHDNRGIHVARATRVMKKTFDALDEEELEARLIEGVEAQGKRTTLTIAAGEIGNDRPIEVVSETWFAPELGVEVLTTRDDPRMGKTTYRLINIQRAEQPLTLFVPPADYTLEEGDPFAGRVRVIRRKAEADGDAESIHMMDLDHEVEIEQEKQRDR